MLKITNRIGLPVTETSGLDHLQKCLNKEHFLNYPKKITYQYNSRGFRDAEWPIDLSDVIWCVGDSFTVGIGQPYEETWPQLLEKRTGRRCLNTGEDGCSNDTIALRAQEICKLYKPKLIVVLWSYFSRRRINDKNVQFDRNDFGIESDIKNFHKNFNLCKKLNVNLINFTIPYAFDDIKYLEKKYPELKSIRQLDYARDHNHFDIKTSTGICDLIVKKLTFYLNNVTINI